MLIVDRVNKIGNQKQNMRIYIDQSSKLEYTSKDTALAYSNTKQKGLLIKADDKREIQELFRRAGKPYIFIYKTFAILIYLLIKDDLNRIQSIVIDQEYQGREPLIKDFIFQIIRKKSKKIIEKEFIDFERIGRKNMAHRKAINIYQEKIKPDMIVGYKDVLPYII